MDQWTTVDEQVLDQTPSQMVKVRVVETWQYVQIYHVKRVRENGEASWEMLFQDFYTKNRRVSRHATTEVIDLIGPKQDEVRNSVGAAPLSSHSEFSLTQGFDAEISGRTPVTQPVRTKAVGEAIGADQHKGSWDKALTFLDTTTKTLAAAGALAED